MTGVQIMLMTNDEDSDNDRGEDYVNDGVRIMLMMG